jgi:Fungalysin metallopeptidase (M36)
VESAPRAYRLKAGNAASPISTFSGAIPTGAPGSSKLGGLLPIPLTHLALTQMWQGRQVFPAMLVSSITGKGQIVSIAGEVVKELSSKILTTAPNLTSIAALSAAASSLQVVFERSQHYALSEPDGAERRQVFSAGTEFSKDVSIRLLYYVASANDIRLVWEVIVGARDNPFTYQVFVDDRTTQIVYRKSTTNQEAATFRAYFAVTGNAPVDPELDYTPLTNPAPLAPGPPTPNGSQGIIVPSVMLQEAGDPTASRDGWITGTKITTTGNNAVAFVDRNNNYKPDPGEQPTGSIDELNGKQVYVFDFVEDLNLEPGAPANEAAATVNAFVVANWWHDRMYKLGFNELAGNFQQDNGGAGGVGGDPVRVRLHVGTNGSMFETPPTDGACCPTLNSYTWNGPTPNRDSGLDQEILIHELTHGLTNRVIGGGASNGLDDIDGQPGGLGEGYSDFYAIALLRRPNDDPDGIYVVGGYSAFSMNEFNLPQG